VGEILGLLVIEGAGARIWFSRVLVMIMVFCSTSTGAANGSVVFNNPQEDIKIAPMMMVRTLFMRISYMGRGDFVKECTAQVMLVLYLYKLYEH